MSGCLTERTFSFGPLPARPKRLTAVFAQRRLRPAPICASLRPFFMPSLPALTLSRRIDGAAAVRSRCSYSTSAISSARSSPTRSDCSIGPSTAVRAPNPSLTTVSTVSASHTPAATSAKASRFIACCSRLPTKPGTSRRTCTGVLPASRSKSMVARTTASLVFSFWMTSTSGTKCGGFQKCVPMTRSRCLRSRPISVVGIAELLLARIVSGATALSSSAKIFCLSGSFSGAASNTKLASCTA